MRTGSIVLFFAAGVVSGCQSDSQVSAEAAAFTPGALIKHQGTEITNPTSMVLRASAPPTLNFHGDVGSQNLPLRTNGQTVDEEHQTAAIISPRPLYDFYVDTPGLMVRRTGPQRGLTLGIQLEDGGVTHTFRQLDDAMFDVRPDRRVLTGWVVIAATTTTTPDPTPRKRLFRIDVASLERKLQ